MGTAKHGPEFRPVSREDKVEEWFGALQSGLRHRDGTRLTDGEATAWADRFWGHLAGRSVPVRDIMNADSQSALEWVLNTDQGLVLFIGKAEEEEE